jgi:hypothetical protein
MTLETLGRLAQLLQMSREASRAIDKNDLGFLIVDFFKELSLLDS